MILKELKRIVVFLHPGQLSVGIYAPVTFLDDDSNIKEWEKAKAIKIYDGPSNGSIGNEIIENALKLLMKRERLDERDGDLESNMAWLKEELGEKDYLQLTQASLAEILGSLSLEKILTIMKDVAK